jgi:WD40 repeat protein
VYFNSSYKYTVTGLFNGNVRVWRLPLVLSSVSKATTPNDYIMIHNCTYHAKLVEKIVATDDDRVIISQSADLTVCMWSL